MSDRRAKPKRGAGRGPAALLAAKNAAERASRTKSAYLAAMSHEIRTPLTAILGFADLLLDPSQNESQRRDAALTIRRSGEHLLAIVNGVLDMARIESGQLSLELIPTSPRRLLDEVCSLMAPSAACKGIQLKKRVTGRMPAHIRTDPTRLRQILINLVGNALKFTEKGTVTVIAEFIAGRRPRLRFAVADSGIGMTRDQIDHLFLEFGQADPSIARRFGGTGLGLSISQRLARMLGGEIAVDSEPGRGSVFTVTITAEPVVGRIGEPDLSTGRPPQPTHRAPLAGVTVLLAEDSPDSQRLIGFHLKHAGATVELADNGLAAAQRLLDDSKPRCEIALMDMEMPLLDGYAATRRIRAARVRTPVIALTAHVMPGDRERCFDAGCDDYLAKPIDRTGLIEMCRKWAAAGRSRRARAA